MEFQQKIKDQIPEIGEPYIVLNRIASPSFSNDEIQLLQRLSQQEVSAETAALLEAGMWEQTLERATHEAILRLEDSMGSKPLVFPRFGVLGGFAGGPPKVVEQLTKAVRRASIKVRT